MSNRHNAIKQRWPGGFAREIARAEGYVMAREVGADGHDISPYPFTVPETAWDALPDAPPRPRELVTGHVHEIWRRLRLDDPTGDDWLRLVINGMPLTRQETLAVSAGLGAGHRVEISSGWAKP